MVFSELSRYLHSTHTVLSESIISDVDIHCALLLDCAKAGVASNLVHIGRVSDCKKPCNASNLILVGNDNPPEWIKLYNFIHISNISVEKLFNDVQEKLSEQMLIKSYRAEMLDMFVEGKDLMAIVNRFKNEIRYPLAIMDIRGHILAYTEPFDLPDVAWQENIRNGYCSIGFTNHILHRLHESKTPDALDTFATRCESTDLVYRSGRIYIGGSLFGIIFLFQYGDTVFDDKSVQLLSMIRDIAKSVISRSQNIISRSKSAHNSLLADIFSGMSKKEILERVQLSDITFPENMCLFLVQPKYYRDDRFLFSAIYEKVQSFFPVAITMIHQNKVLIILPADKATPDSEGIIELKKYALREHLFVGMTSPFSDITELTTHYAQIEDTIECAKAMDYPHPLCNYADFSFFVMLRKLPSSLRLRDFCHPALTILKQYDSANETEFFQTLKIYVNSGFSQSKTADYLYLHRNSLNYRLHRIASLCNIDYNDPVLLKQLMTSFYIDEYLINIGKT